MGVFTSVLLAGLAVLLIVAAIGDWRTREIPNWLNAAIAVAAPLWWWATGIELWPDVAVQIGLAAIVFAIFAGFFALGAMGGGDVKLIGALALWFPLAILLPLLMVMAIIGGLLTLAMLVRHRLQRAEGRPEIPYGIAIALAGLWTIFRTLS